MAKVGEGDARWIVKEREDGANCNQWHWSEKNLTPWSKDQLTELLVGIVAMEEGSSKGWCKITSLDKMNGEVTVQSRKQKKFPLYELEIGLKWEGQLWDDAGKVVAEAKGKIKIPDLSEETFDDLEMTVDCEDETKAKMPLKEAMRTVGCKRVREACMSFVKTLRESVNSGADKGLAAKKPATERVNSTYVTAASESTKTKQLKIKYSFAPHPQMLYDTLLDTDRIRGATASDASMSKEVGGKFSMFGGSVEGENVTLTPFNGSEGKAVIVWSWRFNTWQPGKHSKVTIELSEKDGGTELELIQTGVPEEELERVEKGWKGMLFDRLKAMLGGTVMG
uniref:Activator of Hsp90 ATPase AHSA1-like N-terminal domain-containing protein n=1 Tax=Haptolina brevifila TaxID=156173 RepID=A0A7S2NE20_9EUKA|mmetsp:Transcript_74727/g.148538  ORF Transcript_74727/g.148538 Transcript_74727/m.148538 type:complete len:337 (+) Transcript_74727:48-1058(+)